MSYMYIHEREKMLLEVDWPLNFDMWKLRKYGAFVVFSSAPPYLNPQNKNPQMLDSYVSAGKNAAFYCDVMSVPGEDPPSLPIWKKNGRDIGASQGQ